MTDLETLRAMRELIADPAHWTTDYAARTKTGSECGPKDPEATCWCLIGAYHAVTPDPPDNCTYVLQDLLRLESVSTFNDRHSHEEVLECLDRNIARLAA